MTIFSYDSCKSINQTDYLNQVGDICTDYEGIQINEGLLAILACGVSAEFGMTEFVTEVSTEFGMI